MFKATGHTRDAGRPTVDDVAFMAKPKREQRSAVDGDDRVFIFDGDCGFCRKWAGWLEHHAGTPARFVAFQALDDDAPFGLSPEDLQTASYLIDGGGIYRGGRGFARAMMHGRGVWAIVGWLLDLPGLRLATTIAYRLIARNRHRLPAPHDDVTG